MAETKNRPLLIKSINLIWYPVTLAPILLLAYAALSGWVPSLLVAVAMFAFLFWVFSLIFAIVALFRKPRDLRQ